MVLPKLEDGLFLKTVREDLLLSEVTAETGLWYGLKKKSPERPVKLKGNNA